MTKVVENFLKYIKIHTTSDENSNTCPSTIIQMDLANLLKQQCEKLGLTEISLDEKGYLFASLPANISEEVPIIGFISHMDTSPDMSGKNVQAQFIENYDGKDIYLNQNTILSPNEFKELQNYIGKTLITTDGTTLLGADDKAGIAEIMAACEYLINHSEIKHGKIRIAFTPDEEIGRGADFFDVEKFGADFAYTIDGGKIGELEFENFNASQAIISINGKNVHPGSAKNIMKNSLLIANEFISMLPPSETPAHTENYEGFYHLNNMEGNVENSKLHYIIRDFDLISLENREKQMQNIADFLNKKYGKNTIELKITRQYYNMVEEINKNKHIVDLAIKAMKNVDIEPIIQPIRGGTDGSRLSFMGLPCPNIFAGGHNFHGKYEFIPVFAMEKAVEVITEIAKLNAED